MKKETTNDMKLTRRTALAGGLSLALAGFAAQEAEAQDKPKRKRRPRPVREEPWKYVKMDPAVAAQYAYDAYVPWGCMYGAVKGGLKAYAEANPDMAEAVANFPYLALRSGKTGFGAQESLCGTLNGAGLFMGLFIPDYAELCAEMKKLTDFYLAEALPTFVPAEDKYPNFVKTIAPSIMCGESKGTWLAVDDSLEHKQLRQERCIRLTATVIGKAVELLNAYFDAQDAEEDA